MDLRQREKCGHTGALRAKLVMDARDILDDFEAAGLTYFDDYFELSGNWPTWIRLSVADR